MTHVDLSTLKNKKKDPKDEAEELLADLSDDDIAALADKAGEDASESVRTAFTVVVHRNGAISIDTNVNSPQYRPDHIPSMDEIWAASAQTQRDITAQLQAQHSAIAFDNLMMQKTQMAQNQQLAGRLRL